MTICVVAFEAFLNFKIPVFGISYYVFVWSSQFYIKISEISFDYGFMCSNFNTYGYSNYSAFTEIWQSEIY
jgi:hypothetical protein